MLKKTNIITNKKPNYNKLLEYGFTKQNEVYIFYKDILDGDFRLFIYASNDKTTLKVLDNTTNEEYTLIYMPDAVGAFIGTIRQICEDIVKDIIDKCYEANIFKSKYTQKVIRYISDKYRIKEEYLWDKYPNYAVFRNNTKWFALLSRIKKRNIGISEKGMIEILTLKESSDKIEDLIDNKKYFAGYHMNKKSWYTIHLDGSVAIEEIYERIDRSYNLLINQKKKTNKMRHQLSQIEE